MTIQEVTTSLQAKEFLILPVKIYKHEPNWIRPLDKDIESVFDKEKNKALSKELEECQTKLTNVTTELENSKKSKNGTDGKNNSIRTVWSRIDQ